ncbi:MAG: 50S ribosomal protein L5 [Candidatus Pacebacteria bacterium]|nr:50S ribosomal protein L5 [Candidatus Paceibacterota bacterium]NUQ57178.1 50S ribosomal protein L5 [Candidatus Paceibacter sp.]
MKNIKEKYEKNAVPELKKKFGYKNILAVPKIKKVVVSAGVGSYKDETKKELTGKSLATITGQKPLVNKAKKSIASFKLRQGMPIGYSVTLRGNRMYDFLEKLVNVAVPRIRDFRGLDPKAIDHKGSMTIGFKEHIAFPETAGEDVRSAFGLGVTVVSSAKSKEEAAELFKLVGFPFKV